MCVCVGGGGGGGGAWGVDSDIQGKKAKSVGHWHFLPCMPRSLFIEAEKKLSFPFFVMLTWHWLEM